MNWDGKERRCSSYETEILEKLNRIVEFIEGNGKPGANIRLDRLERTTGVIVWAGALLVVGALGFAGYITQQAFSKVFHG